MPEEDPPDTVARIYGPIGRIRASSDPPELIIELLEEVTDGSPQWLQDIKRTAIDVTNGAFAVTGEIVNIRGALLHVNDPTDPEILKILQQLLEHMSGGRFKVFAAMRSPRRSDD